LTPQEHGGSFIVHLTFQDRQGSRGSVL
jgi:hypothetical protein